jgi:hypothetical protein
MENKEVLKIRRFNKVLTTIEDTPVDKTKELIDKAVEIAGMFTDPTISNRDLEYQGIWNSFQFLETRAPVTFNESQLASLREIMNTSHNNALANSGIPRNIITGAQGMEQLNNALEAYTRANLGNNE